LHKKYTNAKTVIHHYTSHTEAYRFTNCTAQTLQCVYRNAHLQQHRNITEIENPPNTKSKKHQAHIRYVHVKIVKSLK